MLMPVLPRCSPAAAAPGTLTRTSSGARRGLIATWSLAIRSSCFRNVWTRTNLSALRMRALLITRQFSSAQGRRDKPSKVADCASRCVAQVTNLSSRLCALDDLMRILRRVGSLSTPGIGSKTSPEEAIRSHAHERALPAPDPFFLRYRGRVRANLSSTVPSPLTRAHPGKLELRQIVRPLQYTSFA